DYYCQSYDTTLTAHVLF
nr:immunoglobulin light chain junction region [Macaca mulatta]MOW59327.1 immunoglobulin light chain junction region [Macaca mulatta]MOW59782.1 immunoglobulin light chain junction region [Macaca mulatta]MOW59783.1 immunoglobulin light chain junction region [Macaca mulatta]MOW61316.1 immunoglobulin light chain junction region [Macaca mulatta]